MQKKTLPLIIICVIFLGLFLNAQQNDNKILKHVEPPFWWVGMKNTQLQLLVHGDKISDYKIEISYPGVEVISTNKAENPNYIFLNLKISENTKPGMFRVSFIKGSKKMEYQYSLKPRVKRENQGQGVDGSDVIYLITPDRFANGDTSNDSTDDTIEKVDRKNHDGRHGGDIKGILDHFDYIKEYGVTTLWLNPFQENDQPAYSYHGYGISDFYKTDSRFGTNEDFKTLVDKSHQNGMKVIMDQVFNHCGAGHWWMNDLPSKDWLNQWESYTSTNFATIIASDPYASRSDYDLLTKGWFDKNLPDLNLENKYMETYMIQNSIWWVEYAGLDGIRMDTYPYPDQNAMSNWMQALTNEYPGFYMVAETWASRTSYLSYWNNENTNRNGYTSYVNSVSDYPLYFAILESFGKEGDIYKLYETLAEDFVYGNAYNNKVFNGNHDQGRIFGILGENVEKLKLSMVFTLTTRGIPQLYYGDEILMKKDKPDGQLREDFPGGWEGDTRNAFTASGRTDKENEVFNYVKTILNWRKNAKSIHQGKLTHYKPDHNVYVYFRHTDNENTMVIINNSDKNIQTFDLTRYYESFKGYSKGIDIITGNNYETLDTIAIGKNTALILDLKK
ncbi:glycoside hydrolase family 13 protein [Aquimarina gracilis]|uniref:Glycoside hydrolase family 13 protein n=1 Tax=Aquimarina gracilis TaxID=874422 RepID=A0ABU5ZU13_9FLAO|nr:glycoside hydrolase family 13 protein [Aquimarina gracilis]MEB3345469.1 glycoside hydrolase family 13 protein [Aquimarina gracilis]